MRYEGLHGHDCHVTSRLLINFSTTQLLSVRLADVDLIFPHQYLWDTIVITNTNIIAALSGPRGNIMMDTIDYNNNPRHHYRRVIHSYIDYNNPLLVMKIV